MNAIHHGSMIGPASRTRQRGVALAVGILMLLVLTVLGISALRSSIFELQMSRNESSRVNAFQRAQSLIDATVADTSNLVVSGSVSAVNCLNKDLNKTIPYSTSNPCTNTNGPVTVAAELITGNDAARSTVFVERLSPEYAPAPRSLGFSVDFDAAQFEVTSIYDASSAKQGASSIATGVMVLVNAAQ